MQTIKTAAVVVLMLTVLYGGYVSLTTPPEPLPNGITEILVIDETGEVELDPSQSLASDLALDEPPAGLIDSTTQQAPGSAPTGLTAPPTGLTSKSNGLGSHFADLAPAPGNAASNSSPTVSMEMPSADSASPSTAVTKLPSVSTASANVSPGPSDAYPSTPATFRMPDPSSASGSFDPKRGTAFAADATPAADLVPQAPAAGSTALDSLEKTPATGHSPSWLDQRVCHGGCVVPQGAAKRGPGDAQRVLRHAQPDTRAASTTDQPTGPTGPRGDLLAPPFTGKTLSSR